jgi:hypothetical protein
MRLEGVEEIVRKECVSNNVNEISIEIEVRN